MDLRLAGIAAALVAVVLAAASAAPAGAAGPNAPLLPEITQKHAEAIAARDPKVVAERREHADLSPVSEQNDAGDWQVGFVSGGDELVQVTVDAHTGLVREAWTGDQVAWRMARGYPGAFGRKLNAPYIWLPLCFIFVAGLFDWRRPLRWANLDLVVLTAGFGVSHFFFNRGEIGLSVPLAYPALLYLMARALWIGFRGGGEGLRPTAPATWLAIATLFLVGFRVGLNMADSNVIDVGYSGVVGADRAADGHSIYGGFPDNDQRGDTYGPANYYAYVPFEQIWPWSGNWDDLPAAHGAAIFFDLATIAGLFALGRRLRPGDLGRGLGAVLAFAWAACPYTAFAFESNSNDTLVAALLVGALLVLTSPPARGAMLALATLTKFAPLALAPLFATYVPPAGGSAEGPPPEHPPWSAGRGVAALTGPAGRAAGLFSLAFAATAALVLLPTIIDPGLSTFWDRTIAYQAGRDSPFSIWGQLSIEPVHIAVEVLAAALAILVAFFPRRRDPFTVAALGAAVLIAFQLTVDHWFYLYIPWFLPFLFVAFAGSTAEKKVA